MSFIVKKLFLDDAYLTESTATVVDVNDRGGIILDQSIFYGTSGGQPGDTGTLVQADGSSVDIATTVCGADKEELILVPATTEKLPAIGETVTVRIDWERRHNLMRMHTALHLLCASVPFPVTGGQIGEKESRLDFNMPESPDREALTQRLNALVDEDHPVSDRWIDDSVLEAQPELIRTMSVKPPMGSGKVRLVSIGEGDSVDLQPCGGTHIRTTSEIGPLEIFKVENKGKQNRRIRVRLAEG